MPDLIHLRLEHVGDSNQLERLLASPESNVTYVKVQHGRGADHHHHHQQLLQAKLYRLAARRAELDRVLIHVACALHRFLPLDVIAMIGRHWASTEGFFGRYQRNVNQVVANLKRAVHAAWRRRRRSAA